MRLLIGEARERNDGLADDGGAEEAPTVHREHELRAPRGRLELCCPIPDDARRAWLALFALGTCATEIGGEGERASRLGSLAVQSPRRHRHVQPAEGVREQRRLQWVRAVQSPAIYPYPKVVGGPTKVFHMSFHAWGAAPHATSTPFGRCMPLHASYIIRRGSVGRHTHCRACRAST